MNTNLPKQLVTVKGPQLMQHIHNKKISTRIVKKIAQFFSLIKKTK